MESTLGSLLKLPPSELKKAQEVVAGGNRSDLLVGGAATPAAAPAVLSEKDAPPAKPLPPQSARKPVAARPAQTPKARGGKAKFATLSRIDTRFREDQIEALTDLELKLRRRDVRSERLTKASILRTLVDLLPHLDLDLSAITDEESLRAQLLSRLEAGRKTGSHPASSGPKNA